MLKKLFSHTAIYGLAPQIPKIAGLVTLPIITKSLTSLDFGVYGLITAIAGAFSVFSTLGLNVSLGNSFYRSPGHFKWAWRQIYGFLILWNFPYSLILGTVLYFFIPAEAKSNTISIIALNILPIVFFGPTSLLGRSYYQYSQKPMQIAVRNIVIGLLTVGLNIYFISVLQLGYMGWFLSICLTEMLNHFTYFVPLYRKLKITPIFNFKWRYIKRQLKVALPIIPHYYANYLLNTSDRVVMKFAKIPTSDIGLYNAAYIPGNMVQSLGFAAGQAVGPMMSAAYRKKNEHTARALTFTLQATFLTCTFILCVWLKEVFHLLIKNKELQSTYNLGIIIIMAYNYRPMYLGANSKLFFYEKTKVLLKVTFIAGLINVILNSIFIPLVGFQIAVYTTFIALMYMGYAGYYLKEFKEFCALDYYPMIWLLLTIAMTVLSYFLVDTPVVVKLIAAALAGAIGIWYVFKINKVSFKEG